MIPSIHRSAAAAKQLADELDPDWAIKAAEKYIREDAPEAEEGNRDNTAAMIARKLFDWPITDGFCHELMTEWNETKCSPPLEADDIARIVRSAAINRQNARGVIGSSSGFEPTAIDESHLRHSGEPSKGVQDEEETKPFVSLATPFSFPDPATIEPPDWILEGLAARAEVSTVTGPGGVSKSTWQLLTAVAAVTGREDICGFRITQRKGRSRRERVWVWNQEDSLDTMNARVAAIMQEFGVSPDDLRDENGKPMLFLDSGRGRGNGCPGT